MDGMNIADMAKGGERARVKKVKTQIFHEKAE